MRDRRSTECWLVLTLSRTTPLTCPPDPGRKVGGDTCLPVMQVKASREVVSPRRVLDGELDVARAEIKRAPPAILGMLVIAPYDFAAPSGGSGGRAGITNEPSLSKGHGDNRIALRWNLTGRPAATPW